MKAYRITSALLALTVSLGSSAQIMTLKDCLETGIRESYQIRLVNISALCRRWPHPERYG